jgi:hypothetical protein
MPILLAALLLVLAQPARAQDGPPPPVAREALVANETERPMQEIYLFPVGAAEAGPDRLGNAVLPQRATLRIPLARGRECNFEVRAVFDDGTDDRRRIDVCRAGARALFAEAGPRREVAVVNDGDVELRELYLVPAGASGSGPDRLGTRTVPPGETLPIRLRGGGPDCLYDLRAVFADDREDTRRRIDLCRTPRIAFGDPTVPVREATVANRSRFTLREVYVRPAGTEPWGADRLGSGVVEPRGEAKLRLRQRGCRFDLRAIYENEREERQDGLDLCAKPMVALTGLPAGVEPLPRRLMVVNAYPRPVAQLYLVPADPDDWGDDLLEEGGTLAAGARQEFTVVGGCAADLRIVFEGDAAEERRNIDLCVNGTVRLRPGWVIADRLEGDPEPPPRAPAPP